MDADGLADFLTSGTDPDVQADVFARIVDPCVTACITGGAEARIAEETFEDLQFFSTSPSSQQSSQQSPSVFDAVDRTTLAGSGSYLAHLLGRPLASSEDLRRRRSTLARWSREYEAHKSDVDADLDEMAAREPDVLWLFRELPQEASEVSGIAFFQGPVIERLNSYGLPLTMYNIYRMTASPMTNVLLPIAYILVPVLRYRRDNPGLPWIVYFCLAMSGPTLSPPNIAMMLSWLVSCFLYCYNLYMSWDATKTLFSICSTVCRKMESVRTFFRLSNRIVSRFGGQPQQDMFDGFFKFPTSSLNHPALLRNQSKPNWIAETCVLDSFKFLCSGMGGNLRDYYNFDEDLHALALNEAYAADCMISIVRLSRDAGYSTVTTVASSAPLILFGDLWLPASHDAAVKNDCDLGKGRPGLLVTGPNAGGKSTFLKAVTIAAIMAQSICVAPVREDSRMSTFGALSTLMPGRDAFGSLSLFQSEMRRVQVALQTAADVRTQTGMPSLLVADELFHSTNPVEGIACSFASLKRMAETGSAAVLAATHYIYLARLSKKTRGKFVNVQMPMHEDTLTPTYRLVPGVCRQCVALDLLASCKGIDKGLVADALEVRRNLSQRR